MEVNIIHKGGNYGWNRFEANEDFELKTKMASEPHVAPVATYGHQWGGSITGGKRLSGVSGSLNSKAPIFSVTI